MAKLGIDFDLSKKFEASTYLARYFEPRDLAPSNARENAYANKSMNQAVPYAMNLNDSIAPLISGMKQGNTQSKIKRGLR